VMMWSGLTPVPGVRKLTADIPLMKKWGLVGFLGETRLCYMEEGVATKYLRARMMWDADLNVKEVMDDYYTHWYSAAARPARAFWDALEDCMEKTPLLGHEDSVLPFVYSPTLINQLEKQVAKAEKLAADERSKTHVHADRLILEHLKYYMAMHDAEFVGDYAKAARLADEMLDCRLALMKISPFYCLENTGTRYQDSDCHVWDPDSGAWAMAGRKARYLRIDGKMNGTTGTLVTMAPRQVKFSLDPQDVGRFQRWHEPGYDRGRWQMVDTCKPFYLQVPGALAANGYTYQGYLWYVFELPVPAGAKGNPLRLYSPNVDNAWVWVNGEFAGRAAQMDLDVTSLIRPGEKNVIAVRAGTSLRGRVFLYSPVAQH